MADHIINEFIHKDYLANLGGLFLQPWLEVD